MDRGALRERAGALKQLAKEQMSRAERIGGVKVTQLAMALADDEKVDLLFGAQIDGKFATVALTDRRVLAAYGLTHTASLDYSAINQIDTGLTKVEVKGSGVDLEMKSVGRRDELVNELRRRRATAGTQAPQPSGPSGSDDPMALLERLAQLHSAGVLSDEEFAAKKTELLGKIG